MSGHGTLLSRQFTAQPVSALKWLLLSDRGSANGLKLEHNSNACPGVTSPAPGCVQAANWDHKLTGLSLQEVSTKWIVEKTCSIFINLHFILKIVNLSSIYFTG